MAKCLHIILTLIVSVAFLSIQPATAEPGDQNALVLGVVPQQASEKLARQWVPLARYLEDQTGHKIRFATAPSIPEFEKRVLAGEYDFAYMNPYHFTVFIENPGYIALVRQREHVLRGIIVVAADSGIESLEELAGRDLAFPAPKAFAATLITRAFLDQAAPGYTATFVNSHDSVYRAVAGGLFAGGGGIVRTYREVDPEVRRQLEILWLSPGFTGHAFTAHARVSEKIRLSVQEAMVNLATAEGGPAILDELGMDGFEPATDSDWDDVRALELD